MQASKSVLGKFQCLNVPRIMINPVRSLFLPSKIPPSIIYPHKTTPMKAPEHHNNPEVERLLREELCNFPPFQARKCGLSVSRLLNCLVKPGFQDAIMKRDYLRRQVSAHFSDLRLRLNAIRKNTILPKEIKVSPHVS